MTVTVTLQPSFSAGIGADPEPHPQYAARLAAGAGTERRSSRGR
jgi:hypothetical protein